MLEAVDAVVFAERAHVVTDGLIPPGDRDMQRVVGGALFGPSAPLLVRIEDALVRIGNDEIDDHRRAARGRRARPREKVLGGHGAHEWQLHVRVRIDPARNHIRAARVDYSCAGHVQVETDRVNRLAFYMHVCAAFALCSNDSSTFYHDCHVATPMRTPF
jgi:hypothetical protein